MAYRKYDTCFFERYATLELQQLLGHKFDDLVNEDRPDLQSSDHRRLGIEVTRAMEQGRAEAQQMLKKISGVVDVDTHVEDDILKMTESGYGYGIHDVLVGHLESDYWRSALPMKQIIASKVGKVASGFYGNFEEFGLFVFSKDHVTELSAMDTVRFILSLQRDNDLRYARLFISCVDMLYACNLEDGISDAYRMTEIEISREQRRTFYLDALKY